MLIRRALCFTSGDNFKRIKVEKLGDGHCDPFIKHGSTKTVFAYGGPRNAQNLGCGVVGWKVKTRLKGVQILHGSFHGLTPFELTQARSV